MSRKNKKKNPQKEERIFKLIGLIFASIFLAVSTIFAGNQFIDKGVPEFDIPWPLVAEESSELWIASLEELPEYTEDAYVVLNNNEPLFTDEELVTTSYETYSALDNLGRVGVAVACIGQDLMPTQERGSISEVTPTGWVQASYDIVDAGWLYNRCHLIGWQLSGEDANEENLITGTRYLNIEGMLSFENMVAEYVEETGNHVMYRVTPHFEGDNLLAYGLQIEAYSVEDDGEGICFHVYCYNVQPNISINYETGENEKEEL